MNVNDKNKVKGLVATVLFHAMLIIAFIYASLYYSYPPKDNELLEPKKEEIFFGGEYVMLGDVLQIETGSMSEGGIIEDSTEPSPVVTQETDSPMKVQPVEQTPEPSAEELAAEAERVRQEKEKAEKAAKVNKLVGGAFKKSSTDGNVTTGSSEESAIKRTNVGAPGVSGLEGYTLASWVEAKSTLNGVVKIKVRVNARGKVISARYDSGSGSAAGSLEVRRNCEQAAMKCQFSVPENTTTEGVGVITYNFTPKSK